MARAAYTCGEDCMMLHVQTADGFVHLGYSVVPGGSTFDTNKVEATQHAAAGDDRGWNFDFKLGAQRPSLLRTGRKIAWGLQESYINHGSIRQIYTRKRDDERWVEANGRRMSNIDGVIELLWIQS